ncbi:hypothetical protein IFM89_012549, partial [Coptis chinensis]
KPHLTQNAKTDNHQAQTMSEIARRRASSGDADYFKVVPMDVLINTTDEHGESLLAVATFGYHLDCCKEIFKRCPSLLYHQSYIGNTVLHHSAYNGVVKLIKFFISAGAETDIERGERVVPNKKLLMMVNKSMETALHIAVIKNNLEAVHLLIEADPGHELLKMVNNSTETVLHIAVIRKNLEAVKLLIAADVDHELLKMVNKYQETALHLAVESESGIFEIMRLLIEADPDKELLRMVNDKKKKVFCLALENGNFEILKLLIEGDSNKELLMMFKDSSTDSALHLAVRHDNLEIMDLFIRNDTAKKLAEIVNKDMDTALHLAVRMHSLEAVKMLIEAYPSVEYRPNGSRETPLLIALQNARSSGNSRIRNFLLEKQPNQSEVRTGDNSWTLLHHASYQGDLDAIGDIILLCPSCFELVDNKGRNFLHIAAKQEHLKVVKRVLGIKDVPPSFWNVQDNDGNTPLHIAALGGSESLALCLLYDSRVDKNTVNKHGQKVLDAINFEYDKAKAGIYGFSDRMGEKELKDQSDFDLLVSALIATVSFTAGITVPGGYISDGPHRGTAVLSRKKTFQAFVILNTFALLFSLFAVLCHFCTRRLVKKEDIIFLLNVATFCTLSAIFAMVVAFITGSYVVLAISDGLAVAVCVICCTFFIFAFLVVWRVVMQRRHSAP